MVTSYWENVLLDLPHALGCGVLLCFIREKRRNLGPCSHGRWPPIAGNGRQSLGIPSTMTELYPGRDLDRVQT